MNNVADLVVFGTVYTAEDNKVCEAFAVKDGKYVYVGDREGAEGYIERGVTKVIDNGNVVLYHFEVDYPKSSTTYCDVIRQWLIKKVNESLTNDEDVPEANAIYIGYNCRHSARQAVF